MGSGSNPPKANVQTGPLSPGHLSYAAKIATTLTGGCSLSLIVFAISLWRAIKSEYGWLLAALGTQLDRMALFWLKL
jgi:hypothetical protein